jgi:hypothetical protein
MKTPNPNKLNYWRNHIDQSKKYPEGIQAYCKANKLATSVYYKWRERILDLPPSKIISKKSEPAFLPVVVQSPIENRIQSYPHIKQLPDGRWVAEIITNVIRGLL